TTGFSPRLGFQLREDLALQLRYSIYQSEISLPSFLANCNNNPNNPLLAFNPSPAFVNATTGSVMAGAAGASGGGQGPRDRRRGGKAPGMAGASDCGATATARPRCRCARNCRTAPR